MVNANNLQTIAEISCKRNSGNILPHQKWCYCKISWAGKRTSLHSDIASKWSRKTPRIIYYKRREYHRLWVAAQPANKNGTFTVGSQTAIYEYRKPAGDVTTVYVDDEGNVISIPGCSVRSRKTWTSILQQQSYRTTLRKAQIPNANGVSLQTTDCNLCLQKKRCRKCDSLFKSVYDSDLVHRQYFWRNKKAGLPYTTSPEKLCRLWGKQRTCKTQNGITWCLELRL